MPIRSLALALAGAVSLTAAPAVAAPDVRVALLPLVVHTAEADSEYLSSGLAEMLAARLEQNSAISVIRVEGNARTTKPALAIEMGRNAGADYVVFGAFTQFGSGASLDVRCARVVAEGEEASTARRVFVQSGSLGEIIPELDTLVSKLRRFLEGRATLVAADDEALGDSDGARLLSDLQRRVDALERTVYEQGEGGPGEVAPSAGAAPPAPGDAGAPPAAAESAASGPEPG